MRGIYLLVADLQSRAGFLLAFLLIIVNLRGAPASFEAA